MIEAKRTEVFSCDLATLWQVITDNEHISWRKDLLRIDVLDATHSVEVTKTGEETTFTIVRKEEPTHYEFYFENKVMMGTWIGLLKINNSKETVFTSIEGFEVKNFLLHFLAKSYLKKMQKNYFSDLQCYLHLKEEGKNGNNS